MIKAGISVKYINLILTELQRLITIHKIQKPNLTNSLISLQFFTKNFCINSSIFTDLCANSLQIHHCQVVQDFCLQELSEDSSQFAAVVKWFFHGSQQNLLIRAFLSWIPFIIHLPQRFSASVSIIQDLTRTVSPLQHQQGSDSIITIFKIMLWLLQSITCRSRSNLQN